MPFFRYTVQDLNGKLLNGTISATDQNEATSTLYQRGFKVVDVTEAVRATAPNPAPVGVAPPPPAPVQAGPPTIKTRPGSNKALFLLTSQMSSLMRSGVTPHVGLSNLANHQRHPGYRTALEDLSASVAKGGSMSATMERYPYLFPPDAVGTVRAGELGGFLPEAFGMVAAQTEASHRLSRRLFWLAVMALLILAIFPLVLAIVKGSLSSMRRQEEAGGSLPPVDTLVEEIGRSNVTLLPASLAAIILLVTGLVVWHSMPLRTARHRASLGIPFLAGRAKAEAMARFTWVMQMLSRSGLPPVVVFRAAAETIPNIVLRDRLLSAAQGMGEKERLSQALKRARFFPEEHELMVENGEFVGDVPGALAAVASSQAEEFRRQDSSAVHRVGCMIYPFIGVMVLMMLVYLWSMWYQGLFKLLLTD